MAHTFIELTPYFGLGPRIGLIFISDMSRLGAGFGAYALTFIEMYAIMEGEALNDGILVRPERI